MIKSPIPHLILRTLASLRLAVACLLTLAILTVWGTLYQVDHGLYAAKVRFFGAWVVMVAGWIPLPGVKLTIAVLTLNLLATAAAKIDRSLRNAGVVLVHLGVVILIAGSAITHYSARESVLTLREGELSNTAVVYNDTVVTGHRELPVTVELIDFVKKTHPGTAMPSSFESKVHVVGPGIDRGAVISMNRPLRYKSFTFFQSGYSQSEAGETTTLAVVENSGRMLPYAATLVMAAGLLLHFVVMLIAAMRDSRGRRP